VPAEYSLWVKQSALEYFENLPYREQERLYDAFERIRQHPYDRGDYRRRGDDGREWEVRIMGKHAVGWWVDYAVCEVRVTSLKPADRG
jgi:hypothetical protein